MSPRKGVFQIVPGLRGDECNEFETWLLSYSAQEDIMSSIMLEYEKMKCAGLTRDTARYLYDGAYETHIAPFDEISVYFLFMRELANAKIVSLGQSSVRDGEASAIALAYRRACTYLGRTSMHGYRIS